MDDLSHAHDHQPRSDAETLFAIEVAITEVVNVTENHSRAVIARMERMETIVMTTLTDIQTKLGTLSTMLDAKAAADNADLTTIGTQIDDIIEKHTDAPAAGSTSSSAAIDPTTGLPVT